MSASRSFPEPSPALAAAWNLLRDALSWLAAVFGAPEALRAQGAQSPKDRALLLSWLRGLEALAARLLLLAAQAVSPPQAARAGLPRRCAPGSKPPRKPAWRVRLRIPGARARVSRDENGGAGARRAHALPTAAALAARYEALRRVAANPLAYAARMARRLRRDNALPRRVLGARLRPRDPFTPSVEDLSPYLLAAFPPGAGDTS
ncbi:MAG: hypothetical protein AB7L65_03065 [Hyphomonadaceae bacterium]